MKIAIVGTRGIPNNYGGYEQFAQRLSEQLAKKGMQVAIYTPSYRKDVSSNWNGIKIRKIFFVKLLGSIYHFIYDFLAIKNAIKKNDDIILICGYATSFFGLIYFKKYRYKILVHTDGLEWKRKKWNRLIKSYIKFTERKIANLYPYLITDHVVIQEYFKKTYNKDSFCISYGYSEQINLRNIENNYYLMIARNEKENQIDLVIKSYLASNSSAELWIFTNKKINTHHRNIKVFYNIYDEKELNNYRLHAKAYIHAHTVGGTNPSLIEAMGFCKLIIAHDNPFNRQLLNNSALYFNSQQELILIFNDLEKNSYNFENYYKNVVNRHHQWDYITNQYIAVFNKIVHEKNNLQ